MYTFVITKLIKIVLNIHGSSPKLFVCLSIGSTLQSVGICFVLQPGSNSSKPQKASSVAGELIREDDSDGHGYYAFVKFYSAADASRALKELSGRLYMKGQHAQVGRQYLGREGGRKA